MMFQSVGHRPRIQQRVRLGATNEGKLVSLMQDYLNDLDILGGYHENCGEATSYFYSAPNVGVHWARPRRNIGSPTPMRGPGAVPGLFATESAMNELANETKIDPVRLGELNEPKIDEGKGIPFSSRHYLECLQLGGERFGWANRNPEVGSMKRDSSIFWGGGAGAALISGRVPAAGCVGG